MSVPSSTPRAAGPAPVGDLAGFTRYARHDVMSGFLVFLIALPLCLGISLASGYPPLAGIFTAIVGALLATFLSNAEMTIKGPAAGLIVIVAGCVAEFGGDGAIGGFTDLDQGAYRAALAVGVAAAVLQIAFAYFRAGILGEFFPTAAVHGMLAAIGVIIMIKQFPVALGVSAKGEPLEMLRQFPSYIAEANPAIAAIGLVSLAILFAWPTVKRRAPALGLVPAPIIVVAVAVAMGMVFDLMHPHSYTLSNHKYQLGEQYLVAMPDRVLGMFDEITTPDFAALSQPKAWKWVLMFFAIGSLETLLSAKAVDSLDPWRRKTNLDRDVLAVGVANLAASCVGGLPMISEIVRSRANVDNGGRTRFANLWHGVFLLACVALAPMYLHRIPLAALAAMLVYTGSRLAHPTEFVNAYRIGREQLVIFATTVFAVLATDLLIGVGIGVAVKMLIHLVNGVPLSSMFKPFLEVEEVDQQTSLIVARGSAVFSNWIPFRRQIEQIGLVQRRNIVVDLSNTRLVDHSVMEKLGDLRRDFEREGLALEVRGLDTLRPYTADPHAARKRDALPAARLALVIEAEHADAAQDAIAETLRERGGEAAFVATPGAAAWGAHRGGSEAVRIDVLGLRPACDAVVEALRDSACADAVLTAWIEPVEPVPFGPTGAEAVRRELATRAP